MLGKIHRSIGERSESLVAPRRYELPPAAVAEAVVNALAHRDYYSNASVEVRLLADRLEIWNPGALPGTLTLEDLHGDHASIPNNPLLAESLYLTGYIEKLGSGTLKMIDLCAEAGLPEPTFELRSGSFVLTLWRNRFTPTILAQLRLNARQLDAVAYMKTHASLANTEYQARFEASKRTASRDLDDLVRKGVFEKLGTTGKGVRYVLTKGATKGPKGPRRRSPRRPA